MDPLLFDSPKNGSAPKSTSTYPSILWNGKLGTLILEDQKMVFAGLSGIQVSIPWGLVAWQENSSSLSSNNVDADIRVRLANGQNLDLQFADNQDISQVQADIAHRLQQFQHAKPAGNAGTGAAASQDGTEDTASEDLSHEAEQEVLVPMLVQQGTEEQHIDSVLKELEQDIQLANATLSSTHSEGLESENLNLRDSVTSLMNKVGQLETQLSQQEQEHKSTVSQLATQFEQLQQDLRGIGPTAMARAGPNEIELVNCSRQASSDLDETNPNPYTASIPPGDMPPVGDLTMRFLMQGLDDEESAPMEERQNHNSDKAEEKTNSGIQLPFPLPSQPALFTVPDNMATEEGMNLIRRKLNFRKSSVTGQGAYAMTLPSDTYGFLMVAPVLSTPFLMGFMVFAIQMITFLLMAISIVEEKAFNNNFGIPPNVDTEVKVLQFFAIIIAVVTQDDLMKGLDQVRVRKSKSFMEAYPFSNLHKVFGSISLRCAQGCLGLVASFLLIITSETIYYLLLNFTALEFVTQLDEAFFVLSSYGFAGKTCEIAAKAIDSTTYYVHTRVFRARKIVLFTIIAISMIAGWSVVVNKQRNGHFLCKTIEVQFSDEYRPELGTFSGLYDQVRDLGDSLGSGVSMDKSRHLAYLDRLSQTAVFAYCQEEQYWTFQYRQEGFNENTRGFDPCQQWVVRSPVSDAYDIVMLNSANWIVRNDLNREIFLDPFTLMCHDCGGGNNDCTGRGICSGAVCECQEGFYGLQCQFEEPCEKVEMDSRFHGFVGTRVWSQNYSLFRLNDEIINSYNRPVYMHDLEDLTYELMFFTGRRWALSYSTELPEYFPPTSNGTSQAKEALADVFRQFSAHWLNLTLAFVSEPMDLFTPGDSQSPVGIQWYSAMDKVDGQVEIQMPDLVRPVEARLLCAVCSDDNPCLYSGTCNGGNCTCQPGSDGPLCEQPPLANGRCDVFLNTPQYDFDGGDCCGTACVNGEKYHCGREISTYGYIGYQCKNSPDEWVRVGNKPILGEDKAQVGYSVALSRPANFLVVGMPGLDKVLVYDRTGSIWKQRGSPLAGEEGSSFGEYIRLSRSKYSLWNNPRFQAPYTLAIRSHPYGGNSTIDVYKCGSEETNCRREHRFEEYYAFDIADDGEKIALGEVAPDDILDRPGVPQVHVYSLVAPQQALFFQEANARGQQVEIIKPIYGDSGQSTRTNSSNTQYKIEHISLSRDAETMAIQTRLTDYDKLFEECDFDNENAHCEYVYIANSIFARGSKSAVLMQQQVKPMSYGSRPIVLSANSNVVAYASWECGEEEPMAHVFKWNGSEWERRLPMPPFPEDLCTDEFKDKNISLSLSANGATIAVGFIGEIYILDFDGRNWQPTADATPDTSWLGEKDRSAVSISADDASAVAIGLPGTDLASSGMVEVVERVLPNSRCRASDKIPLHLSLTTDGHPMDLSWSVFVNETKLVTNSVKPGFYQYLYATHVHSMCIPKNNCTIVTVEDSGSVWDGPGLTPPGRMDLLLDNEVVAEGNFLGNGAKRVFIGDDCLSCWGGTGLFQVKVRSCEVVGWELVDNVGTTIFRQPLPETNLTVADIADLLVGNQTLPPNKCEWQTQWEDVCINYDTTCYVFYLFLIKHPDADPYYPQTRYYLFYNGEEIHREDIMESGQTSFFVGACKEPRRLGMYQDFGLGLGWTDEDEM